MKAFRHQNVKKLISHQKYLFWSITISKCGIAIHPVNRQHQDFNMESKSNQKYAILNRSINHISRKLNLIYDIDFVVQHIKAEGEWIAISYANCTFVLTNKQPFLKLPSTGMRWDVGMGGEFQNWATSLIFRLWPFQANVSFSLFGIIWCGNIIIINKL